MTKISEIIPKPMRSIRAQLTLLMVGFIGVLLRCFDLACVSLNF